MQIKSGHEFTKQAQEKTKALISGKPKRIKEEIQAASLPALPDLRR